MKVEEFGLNLPLGKQPGLINMLDEADLEDRTLNSLV